MAQVPNQFSQAALKGMMDLRMNPNMIPCVVKSDEVTALVPGQAVKMVDSYNGVPVVTAVAADTDDVFGFVPYNIKNVSYAAGQALEVAALHGNVMYMEASAAISRGAQVMAVVSGSKVATAAGAGKRIVGRALDKASGDGALIRVVIDLPGGVVKGAAVADIAVPGTATAEDCANKINALLAQLRLAGVITA